MAAKRLSEATPRTDSQTTPCKTSSISVGRSGSRTIDCAFDGYSTSSDGGLLILQAAEDRFGILRRLADAFTDHRSQALVEHDLQGLIRQRCFGLMCGYSDLNDHDVLGRDPLLAAAIGKKDLSGANRDNPRDHGRPCAGKSTLSRLDCSTDGKFVFDMETAQRGLLDVYFSQTSSRPDQVVLDFDASCSRLYGHQELRHFLAQYNEYCYLPLFVFCGDHLLAAELHPADTDAGHTALPCAGRVVAGLRAKWPDVSILIRADAGYCREELLAFCEKNNVDYVIGLAKNNVLNHMISGELAAAKAASESEGEPARVFADLVYQTKKTWSRERRVVAKAEYLCADKGHSQGKSNPRYVVTSVPATLHAAQSLYEDVYCARGDMENRLKEVQLGLFSERLPCSTLAANAQRLIYAAYSYALFTAIRRHALQATPHEALQSWTFRARLLKVGAVVRISVRRVWVTISAAFPHQAAFRKLLATLLALPRLLW